MEEGMAIKDASEFWRTVMDAGYLMEGESRDYERRKMAELSEALDEYLAAHPNSDFAMQAVARLAGAFVFNDWVAAA